MLKNFFALDKPYEKLGADDFQSAVAQKDDISNILYSPNCLERQTIKGKAFKNVSFSKTKIAEITFRDCKFIDCLFIGTELEFVEFHNCIFTDCNFYKSKFKYVYGKPQQFRKAIRETDFSNIAVHLYHQLRENYHQMSQREFKNEAEFYFYRWARINKYREAKRSDRHFYRYFLQHTSSWLYDYLLGYGYRIRNLVITTSCLLVVTVAINYSFSDLLFKSHPSPSLLKTIYFTLTTMTTLGASGYNPNTNTGYIFVVCNVIFGISIFSATVAAILKKVIR